MSFTDLSQVREGSRDCFTTKEYKANFRNTSCKYEKFYSCQTDTTIYPILSKEKRLKCASSTKCVGNEERERSKEF